MKKHISFFILFFLVILCKGQNEVKKWNFAAGIGIYQAPVMQGEKVEDKYFDLEYCGALATQLNFGRNKKHSLGAGLNYALRSNRFECKPDGMLNNILYEDSIFVKIKGKYVFLNIEYGYKFLINNTAFNIGVGTELLSAPLGYNYIYKSKLFENISIENFYGGFRKRPYLFFEKPITVFKKLEFNMALNFRFNFDKNTFLNRLFINSQIYSINVYDNLLTIGCVINFKF